MRNCYNLDGKVSQAVTLEQRNEWSWVSACTPRTGARAILQVEGGPNRSPQRAKDDQTMS